MKRRVYKRRHETAQPNLIHRSVPPTQNDFGVTYSDRYQTLGSRPTNDEDRRWQARFLLAGRASILAVAMAWYGGDVNKAKHDIYRVW